MNNTPKNDTRVVSRDHIPPPLRDGVPLDAGVADLVHGFHFPVAVSDSVSKRYSSCRGRLTWSGGDLPEILWAALCVIRGRGAGDRCSVSCNDQCRHCPPVKGRSQDPV